ncbi:MAG: transcriptional repressor [Succinivibrio sp.]
MEKSRRRSVQRDQLREIMRGRTDHPDAQRVYDELKAVMPRISLGTVYRNLMLLASEGELQVLDVGDGKVRFDPNSVPHAHFLCTKCHGVSDMPVGSYVLKVNAGAAASCGRIEGCAVSFRGICPSCLAKQD